MSQTPGEVRPASFAAGVGGQGRAPQAGDAPVGVRKTWGSRVCPAEDVRAFCTACVPRPGRSPSSSAGAIGLVPPVRVTTSAVASPLPSPSRQLPLPELSWAPLLGAGGPGRRHLPTSRLSTLLTEVGFRNPQETRKVSIRLYGSAGPRSPLQRRAWWIEPAFEEEEAQSGLPRSGDPAGGGFLTGPSQPIS